MFNTILNLVIRAGACYGIGVLSLFMYMVAVNVFIGDEEMRQFLGEDSGKRFYGIVAPYSAILLFIASLLAFPIS